ncbi:MAG: hypothetical protein JKX81_14825 [Arenicella sp.]|nr:hypothetical protein [Arenicella sp.]
MKKFAAILLVLSLLGWWQGQPADIDLPPGAKAPHDPLQTRLKNSDSFTLKGHQVSPLARFDLEAKVLAKKRYRTDRGAELAPFDLALGWGVMSDQSVVDALSIRQTGRWYIFRTRNQSFPHPMDLISRSSANMHMVPSSVLISRKLSEIRVGSIVKFSGKLVSISHRDGFRWKSSLTRNDQGDGACELFYVESIRVTQE